MRDITIIIPTLNEVGNVQILCERIAVIMGNLSFEILFIDDNSQDGTLDELKRITFQVPNIRFIRRMNSRGISSAFTLGAASSDSKYIVLIDGDLQHDENLIPQMLDIIKSESLDIVVASRFKNIGKSPQDGLSYKREKMSKIGNMISRLCLGVELTDPLSGFFIVRRSVIERVLHKLSDVGFKILLDIFATYYNLGIKLKFQEIQMHFKKRNSGESKLDIMAISEFVMLIFDKLFGRFIPVRFALFILVGLSGLFVHSCCLYFFLKFANLQFLQSQILSTLIAMNTNFIFNNLFTYRDKRIKGIKSLAKGLVSFCAACALGAIVNIFTADFLYSRNIHWLVSGVLGGMAGAIWNYGITSYFTWGKPAPVDDTP